MKDPWHSLLQRTHNTPQQCFTRLWGSLASDSPRELPALGDLQASPSALRVHCSAHFSGLLTTVSQPRTVPSHTGVLGKPREQKLPCQEAFLTFPPQENDDGETEATQAPLSSPTGGSRPCHHLGRPRTVGPQGTQSISPGPLCHCVAVRTGGSLPLTSSPRCGVPLQAPG